MHLELQIFRIIHQPVLCRYVLLHYKEEKGGFTAAVNRLLDTG